MTEMVKYTLRYTEDGESFIEKVEPKIKIPQICLSKAKDNFYEMMTGENWDIESIMTAYFQYGLDSHDDMDLEDYGEYLEIYSYEFLTKIIDELKIVKNEGRWLMACAILNGAYQYRRAEAHLDNDRLIMQEYKDSMKRLRGALDRASKEIGSEIGDEGKEFFYQSDYISSLQENASKHSKDETSFLRGSFLIKAVAEMSSISCPREIGDLIDLMIITAEEQFEKPKLTTEKQINPINYWMTNIAFEWQRSGELPLTQAKPYKGVGYVSIPIKILEDIMSPLNKKVTNQQIGRALKLYLTGKTDKKFDYMDD